LAQVQKLYTDFLSAQATSDLAKIQATIKEFESVVDRFPDCVEAFALLAKVLQETGNLDGAEEMFKKGMQLNPNNSNLVVHLASCGCRRMET